MCVGLQGKYIHLTWQTENTQIQVRVQQIKATVEVAVVSLAWSYTTIYIDTACLLVPCCKLAWSDHSANPNSLFRHC